MDIQTGMEVLISQSGSCHNGDVGSVYKVTTLGALVSVRGCVHLFARENLRHVPEPDAVPHPDTVR